MLFNRKSNLQKHIIVSNLIEKNHNIFFTNFPKTTSFFLLLTPIFFLFSFYSENKFPLFYDFYMSSYGFILIPYLFICIMIIIDWICYYSKTKDFITHILYGNNTIYSYKKFLKEKNKALEFLFSMRLSQFEIKDYLIQLEKYNEFNNNTLKYLYQQYQTLSSKQCQSLINEEHKPQNIINDFLNQKQSLNKQINTKENQEIVFFKKDKAN